MAACLAACLAVRKAGLSVALMVVQRAEHLVVDSVVETAVLSAAQMVV